MRRLAAQPTTNNKLHCKLTSSVAVSYDIHFHRYLVEGDRAHHYNTVIKLSERKSTALGEGYFFTDRMECLDQNGELFAEVLITYFQYRPNTPGPETRKQDSAAAAERRSHSLRSPPGNRLTRTSQPAR